jgi:hypothetical protein
MKHIKRHLGFVAAMIVIGCIPATFVKIGFIVFATGLYIVYSQTQE